MTMTAEQSRQTGGYYAQQWTVRDEYAARAMDLAERLFSRNLTDGDYDPLPDEIAECAGHIADAMLAERARKPETVAAPPTGNPKYPDAATGYCESSDSLHLCGRDRDLVGFHDCGVGCHVNLPAHEGNCEHRNVPLVRELWGHVRHTRR